MLDIPGDIRAVLVCRNKQSRRVACQGPWRSLGISSGGHSSRQPHYWKKLLQQQKLPAWQRLAPGRRTPQPGIQPGPLYARCTLSTDTGFLQQMLIFSSCTACSPCGLVFKSNL